MTATPHKMSLSLLCVIPYVSALSWLAQTTMATKTVASSISNPKADVAKDQLSPESSDVDLSNSESTQRTRPNVLFISIDDLNDWLGCLDGHPQTRTPNIDRLAARGILFTNAHCAAPACNPSRAAVFSGRMPANNGVWSNKSPRLLKHYPQEMVLPRVFQKGGYATLGTGKLLHSRSSNKVLFEQSFNPEQRWSPFTGEQVQYDERELPSKGTNNPRHVISRKGRSPVVLPLNRMPSDRKPKMRVGESFDWGPIDMLDSQMGDAQITDWAIERMDQPFDRPFFLGVGYYRPHIPLWVPQKYFDRFQDQKVQLPPTRGDDLEDLSETGRRWAIEPITAGLHSTVVKHGQWEEAVKAYLACITFVDTQVGRLLDAIDSNPNGTNTIILLWSDHGWHLGEKQHWGKWTLWERSTRVPLLIVPPKRWAGRYAKPGTRCSEPVSLIDLYPTLADLCEVKVPHALDGKSLVPLLHNPQKHTGRIVQTTMDRGNITLRSERWRYIRYADQSEEFYDLRNDRNEWNNLADSKKDATTLKEFRNQIPASASVVPQPVKK